MQFNSTRSLVSAVLLLSKRKGHSGDAGPARLLFSPFPKYWGLSPGSRFPMLAASKERRSSRTGARQHRAFRGLEAAAKQAEFSAPLRRGGRGSQADSPHLCWKRELVVPPPGRADLWAQAGSTWHPFCLGTRRFRAGRNHRASSSPTRPHFTGEEVEVWKSDIKSVAELRRGN